METRKKANILDDSLEARERKPPSSSFLITNELLLMSIWHRLTVILLHTSYEGEVWSGGAGAAEGRGRVALPPFSVHFPFIAFRDSRSALWVLANSLGLQLQ